MDKKGVPGGVLGAIEGGRGVFKFSKQLLEAVYKQSVDIFGVKTRENLRFIWKSWSSLFYGLRSSSSFIVRAGGSQPIVQAPPPGWREGAEPVLRL